MISQKFLYSKNQKTIFSYYFKNYSLVMVIYLRTSYRMIFYQKSLYSKKF